jgi:hypothetical protein
MVLFAAILTVDPVLLSVPEEIACHFSRGASERTEASVTAVTRAAHVSRSEQRRIIALVVGAPQVNSSSLLCAQRQPHREIQLPTLSLARSFPSPESVLSSADVGGKQSGLEEGATSGAKSCLSVCLSVCLSATVHGSRVSSRGLSEARKKSLRMEQPTSERESRCRCRTRTRHRFPS